MQQAPALGAALGTHRNGLVAVACSSAWPTWPSASGRRRQWVMIAVVLCAVMALMSAVSLHGANADEAVTVSCPYGWNTASLSTLRGGTSHQCVRIIQNLSIVASAADATCATLLTRDGEVPVSKDGVTPWPYARYVRPHGAAVHSAEENAFLVALFRRSVDVFASADDVVLVLGGVAGYGEIEWYADADIIGDGGAENKTQSPFATLYDNFAAGVDWKVHSGVIAMKPNGQWTLVPSAASPYPVACSFEAVSLPPSPPSDSGLSNSGDASSSSLQTATSRDSANGSSGATQPSSRRAKRPSVPQPAPPCLDGWTALPSTVDTTDGAEGTVCYRLFAEVSEVGGRLGNTFASAHAHCSAVHPKASLASVLSKDENDWIVEALLSGLGSNTSSYAWAPVTSKKAAVLITEGGGGTSSSTLSARTVFLGGSYMRDGSGAGLIGSWYADQFIFNASAYAMASPSSPAWPTMANAFFSNWGSGEPVLDYGVVGITPAPTAGAAGGTWLGLDPRSTQPYLCSYLNDGSVFPTVPPTPTPDPSPTTSPTPGASTYCLAAWSYMPLTQSCYHVFSLASSDADNSVTSATMEGQCEQVLSGRVVPIKVDRVHAVSMMTIAESTYVGSLLKTFVQDPANGIHLPDASSSGGSSIAGNSSPVSIPVSLAGISFIDSGAGGFYVSGVRELDWNLTEALWAASEPAHGKGCIAVDMDGLWHYIPCGSTINAGSMPANTAVQVVAYTCQYRAADIDRVKDVLPDPETKPPQPTDEPGASSDSGSSSTEAGWLPLGQRIAALSGAVHLVVAAGSTGLYHLQGPNATTPSPASVHGLHFLFAPLSAFYAYPVPQRTADGTMMVSPVDLTSITTVDDLLSHGGGVRYAPCDGNKDQSRIGRARDGLLTVYHSNTSEVGHVCVSQDGQNYVPTSITYEVTEVTVEGFITAPPRSASSSVADANGTGWLPPLFCGNSAISSPPCAVHRVLALAEHATGSVQLVLHQSSDTAGSGTVTTSLSPTSDTRVTHIRFSSSADCTGASRSPFYLLEPDTDISTVPTDRYTLPTSPQTRTAANHTDAVYSIFSYQSAAVHAAHLASLSPVYNSSATTPELSQNQPPSSYYVCVAVQKSAAAITEVPADTVPASRRLLALWNTHAADFAAYSLSSSSSSREEGAADNSGVFVSIAERLAAPTSVSPSGSPTRLYTAVPGLKVHLIPPPVSVKGMWALPPRRLATPSGSSSMSLFEAPRVTLVPTAATLNRSAHYQLRVRYSLDATNSTSPSAPTATAFSTPHVHITQYSSPIILLDGHGIQPGMVALLSQDPHSCNRYQPLPHNDPTTAATTWPQYIDTMVPLSTITMRVEDEDDRNSSSSGSGSRGATATMAYMQLHLNHTGLWGLHPTRTDDRAASEKSWYVCIAHSPLSPFVPLRQPTLKITVHRLHVDSFSVDSSTTFTSSAAAEAADTSTTHLNINTGFAGMLWLHGLDVRLWTSATLSRAQLTFSAVFPSDGTPDDTASQCSNVNLFYAQRALGLLSPDDASRSPDKGRNDSLDAEGLWAEAGTRVGLVVPLGFFRKHSTRRMQVCLSVPLPFATTVPAASPAGGIVQQRRFFVPLVNTTLDVRPIQLLYVGRYSAVSRVATAPASGLPTTTATVIELAEDGRDVVLPLTGYGVRPDMMLFLSSQGCHGLEAGDAAAVSRPDGELSGSNLVQLQSLLNISIVSLYDLPSTYWAADEAADEAARPWHAYRPLVFIVLKHADVLRKAAAERLFGPAGSSTTRTPLPLCLYAPGTTSGVFPTDFRLVVNPPRVRSIRNLPSDAGLLARATAHMRPQNEHHNSSDSDGFANASDAVVVYGSAMDLVVEGFGLEDGRAWFMPAIDCRNASSYLWRTPVSLSPLPSSTTTSVHIEVERGSVRSPLYATSTRYVDPQTSHASWFMSLRPAETSRVGAEANVSSGTYVDRFQWCVRVVEEADDVASVPFVPTGIPYRLVIPAVDGFRREGSPPSGSAVAATLTLPTQNPTKGRWFPMQLTGPLLDVTQAIGSALYMFLAPQALSCQQMKNDYLGYGVDTFGNVSFTAVNGSAVLLPQWLADAGLYQLCASILYPTLASADEGIEAALQFFRLEGVQVRLITAVYGVFALNHSTTVTVEQGQEWTLPISGSLLSNRTLVRFHRTAAQCSAPMVADGKAATANTSEELVLLPDIAVSDDFANVPFFGIREDDSDDDFITNRRYIVLSQNFIRALAAPATFVLCFQPQDGLSWRAAPAISLVVMPHVRHPTVYPYFPADGSEDVTMLTAVGPTKVALEWNTGETSTANVVGAAGRQVTLALWCPSSSPHTHTAKQSSSSSGTGVGDGLVPCGDHRRVMFVKPMDNDENPCFVDAEAVTDDVVRGPYVLDFGVLTLPHTLSSPAFYDDGDDAAATIRPNLTQPWIMCLETGPERWREPTSPMIQLQYTHAVPTGFRVSADDASNTTAPFPAHKATVEATTSAAVDSATGMPIGGNTTLLLFAKDSSQVVYLNGYGIERGHRLRFGAQCEVTLPSPKPLTWSSDSKTVRASSSVSGNSADDFGTYHEMVATQQQLVNTRLYTDALTIEDDNGIFLVPSTHLLEAEDSKSGAAGIPMCLSTDGGTTYARTDLRLRVLPSRLRIDTVTTQRNLLAQLLRDTLLVPQNSRGNVDLTLLLRAHSATSTAAYASSSISASEPVYLPTGAQVLLSTSCSVNSHGIPLLTVATPNVLSLIEVHTEIVTSRRLRICVRSANGAAAAMADSDGQTSENDVGAPTVSFRDVGLYYRVMALQVDRVTRHAWTPSGEMQRDKIQQVVLRRGADESLLLSVMLRSSVANISAASVTTLFDPEDELLRRLEMSPSVLSMLSLPRFYVGRPCFRPAQASEPSSAISPFVTSYAGMQVTFDADNVTASPLPLSGLQPMPSVTMDSLNETLVAALPSGNSADNVPQFSLASQGSICFSVDGGLHYFSVGIVHFTEGWAPTLRASLSSEDAEIRAEESVDDTVDPSSNSAAVLSQTTDAMRVYKYSSTTRRLVDSRFAYPPAAEVGVNHSGGDSDSLRVLAVLGQLTTAMLWTGFLGDDGFAVDGLLYLSSSAASSPAPSSPTSSSSSRSLASTLHPTGLLPGPTSPQPLPFSLDNRLQQLPTGLSVTVVPLALRCYTDMSELERFVRQQDVGASALTTPGLCNAGVRNGVRVRVVPLSLADCNDTVAVDAAFLFDLSVVEPGLWGASTTVTDDGITASSSARILQFPLGIRYAPDGVYALCIRQDELYRSTIMRNDDEDAFYTASYSPTKLRLRVSLNWTITAISGATLSTEDDVVALSQSSNTALSVAGAAVGVRGVPLLFAFAPPWPQTVSRRACCGGAADPREADWDTWLWSGGCATVPEAWDPVTGMSLIVPVSSSSNASTSANGLLLTAPWGNAQGGALHIPAAYTRQVEWNTSSVGQASAVSHDTVTSVTYTDTLRSYLFCYSVDGGLSFRTAGREAGQASSHGIAAVVVPPAIISLSSSRNTSVEATQAQLEWSVDSSTEPAVRTQYLSTSAEVDGRIRSSPHVESFLRGGTVEGLAYPSRPSAYTYAWTSAFVGNGVGSASGRNLTNASRGTTADVPAMTAAVAVVRTSRYGARCDGRAAVPSWFTTFDRNSASTDVNASYPLAMPIFLINLQYGTVWSGEDTAAVTAWRRTQPAERARQFEQANPALLREDWVAQTQELWARYANITAAPLNGQSILDWATDAASAASLNIGESMVVCLSIDGAHFYSADIARAAALTVKARDRQRSVIAAAASASRGSFSLVTSMSPWPLYLRASVEGASSTSSASLSYLWMREVAMVMQLLARPLKPLASGTDVVYLPFTADSLRRFQDALAAALGVDISVVTVQLALSGFAEAPQAATAAAPNLLPTYALVLSFAADAVTFNASSHSETLQAPPDLIYRSVQSLRDEMLGPNLLAKLVSVEDGRTPAVTLHSLTVNFTLRNGVDLHEANRTMRAALPLSPAQEVAWRTLFLSLPHTTLVPEPIPDAEDNDTSTKVKWWAIPLMLLLPICLLYGTYHVYTTYLKPSSSRTEEAPVVENLR